MIPGVGRVFPRLVVLAVLMSLSQPSGAGDEGRGRDKTNYIKAVSIIGNEKGEEGTRVLASRVLEDIGIEVM